MQMQEANPSFFNKTGVDGRRWRWWGAGITPQPGEQWKGTGVVVEKLSRRCLFFFHPFACKCETPKNKEEEEEEEEEDEDEEEEEGQLEWRLSVAKSASPGHVMVDL